MGFVIAPRKAEGGAVLESPDNAAGGHLGAKTAVADPRDVA
jgi:hypothetical protein